jgi:hypothetical protein
MSSFDASSANSNNIAIAIANTIAIEGDEFYEFPIHSLPEFITESSMFIMTMDMCPNSTTFPFLKSKIPTSLKIESCEDFQRLTEADHMFGFTSKTQVQIFENMYNFWLNEPNSSELPLPVKDFSHFGNQVRALFMETNNIMPVRCFQGNFVELFDYLLKRDGLHKVDSGRWPDYTLPYYGAVCNHVEIVKRGLEVGVSVAKDCIDQAIKQKNQQMFDLFVSYKVKFSSRTLEIAAEIGSLEMYKYFLKVAIEKPYLLNNFVLKTLENKENLEYLLQRSGKDLCALGINGEELLEECLKNVYNVEIFQMIDGYFTKPEDRIRGKTLLNKMVDFRPGYRYMPEKVIYKDDYELFTYLQSKGLLINEFLILSAIDTYKPHRLTPGFLKKQFAEQEKILEQERIEALWDAESEEAAAQAAAEREDFERQID